VTVAGLTNSGVPSTGVAAVVLNVTATNPTDSSFLTVYPTGQPRPLASNLNFVAGQTRPNLVQVPVGSSGQVTVYNLQGQTDFIVDIEGYFATTTSGTNGLFNAVQPARICDTRFDTVNPTFYPGNQCTGRSWTPGEDRVVDVHNLGGLPKNGLSAVVLNVTVTNPSSDGFLTIYPTGKTRPLASNLNFVAGQTVPNRVIVPVGSDGQIRIFNQQGVSDVLVDVNGWFTDGSDLTVHGGLFTGTSPTRICDTRKVDPNNPGFFPQNQCSGSKIAQGQTLVPQVAGYGSIPNNSDAMGPAAVVANVTVTNATADGYLTVFPDGASRPLASDLNRAAGETAPNLTEVLLGSNGKMDVFNNAGSVDVAIDVFGWYYTYQ
jgi:hypothetical protein